MNKLTNLIVMSCLMFVTVALLIQVTMVTLSFTNPKLADKVAKEVTWKIDSRFK